MNIENLQNRDLQKWLEIGLMVGIILWLAYLIPFTAGWRSLADRLFPLLSSALVIVLAAVQILRNLSPRVDRILTPEESDDTQDEFGTVEREEKDPATKFRSIMSLLGWITLFPLMVYYLGFGLATPIYSFGILWYYHRDPKYALILTVIFLVAMYVLFIWLLGIQVWDGAWNVPDPLDYL